MSESFEIRPDCSTGIVEITITGLLTVEDVERFGQSLRAAYDMVQAAGKTPMILSDMRTLVVQTAEVVAAFDDLNRTLTPQPRKGALLIDSQLLKMQARRVTERWTMFQAFSLRADAIDWLLSEA